MWVFHCPKRGCNKGIRIYDTLLISIEMVCPFQVSGNKIEKNFITSKTPPP